MYCRACIESALGVASRCPTCRNPLTRGQLTQVLEEVRTPPFDAAGGGGGGW
jgi:hypothetical protein